MSSGCQQPPTVHLGKPQSSTLDRNSLVSLEMEAKHGEVALVVAGELAKGLTLPVCEPGNATWGGTARTT